MDIDGTVLGMLGLAVFAAALAFPLRAEDLAPPEGRDDRPPGNPP